MLTRNPYRVSSKQKDFFDKTTVLIRSSQWSDPVISVVSSDHLGCFIESSRCFDTLQPLISICQPTEKPHKSKESAPNHHLPLLE